MKNILLLLMLVLSLNCLGQIEKLIPAKPSPIKLVNDYATALSESEADSLENKLMAFRTATTNEIAVVILPTINEYAIEDVALGIFRKWGIGVKGKNNGAILLVIKNDHKLRIQTGYGLEGALPDIKCSHIIRNTIKPAFKNGQFYSGIDEGTTAIIRTIDPAFANSLNKNAVAIGDTETIVNSTISQDTNNQSAVYNQRYHTQKEESNVGMFIGFGIFVLFFIFIVIFGNKSNSTSNYSSSSSSDDSFSDSSSSSDSDSSGGDFGGGDSGGGGSSDSW